jgi:6-phosphogluconolactonase (cycloisomerase 2 family)
MSRSSRRLRTALLVATLAVPVGALAAASPAAAGPRPAGVTIYTQTNGAAGNAVLAYREAAGSLSFVASYATGGTGTGAGLGSQGAVAVEGRNLLAVNAGSDELSLFRVDNDGSLTLVDVTSTGGDRPVSVTVDHTTVYVVNAGDRSVTGFRIRGGALDPIAGSRQTLPGDGAAQISFDRNGNRLVVTQKATNTIDVLPVDHHVAGAAVSNPSLGQTPFGFAIDGRNHLIVSNAAGGASGASSLSSYEFSGSAGLVPVSPTVATTQTAACWVALSEDQRFAFTTNAGSGTISSYRVGHDGSLTLAEAVAAAPGAGPLDMAVADGQLFTLNNGSHTISVHAVAADGTLTAAGQLGVPTGVVGLATA